VEIELLGDVMPWPVAWRPFRGRKIAEEMMGPDGKLHSREELAAMAAKKAGAPLSNEEENLITRLRSTPLTSKVDMTRSFDNEHRAKISEFFLRMRERPEDLKAMFEFIARKSSHGFTDAQARRISEALLKDLRAQGTLSSIHINFSDTGASGRLRKVIGPLKQGSEARNSIEGILRNIKEFEDILFSGYHPLIEEVKSQG
jgi:hypothetical protein